MKNITKKFQTLVNLLAIGCTLCFIIPQLLGHANWILELFTHFSFYYGVCLLIAAVLLQGASFKAWRYLYLFIGTAIMAWSLIPPKLPNGKQLFVFNPSPEKTAPAPEQLSILMANVFIANHIAEKNLDGLLKFTPDILLLPEAGGVWKSLLDNVTGYPYRCKHSEDSSSALQVLSKKPMHCDIHYINDLPYARIEMAGKVIYAVHPRPPISPTLAASRKLYLQVVGKHIQNETLPTIVTGDFNLTPFSPLYRDFITQTGLKPTTQKYNPTWRPVFLPIDYTLYKNLNPQAQLSVKKLPRYGSDHYGILTTTSQSN